MKDKEAYTEGIIDEEDEVNLMNLQKLELSKKQLILKNDEMKMKS